MFVQSIKKVIEVKLCKSVLISVCVCVCVCQCVSVCVCVSVSVHADSPGLHAALQRLQTGLDQVQRLEQQRGAGPAQGAAHEGFEGRVSLRRGGDEERGDMKDPTLSSEDRG